MQFLERAGLDDASAVEHQNFGRLADGRKAMSDDKGGAVLHHLVQRRQNAGLGRRVERTGRLIEDQYRRILEQGARDGQALAFAAGEGAAALTDHGVEAVRICVDEIECLRTRRGVAQFVMRCIRLSDPQVLRDRAVEQQGFLKDHADIAAQGAQLNVAYVGAVDRDLSRLRIEGAMQERESRRFAGAGRADKRHGLARQRCECQTGDRGAYEVVAERDTCQIQRVP